MPRYRYTVFGKPKGRWRATLAEAEDDVRAARQGQYDELTRRFWCTWPAAIERLE